MGTTKAATQTWVAATAVGVSTMLLVQWVFRTWDPNLLNPVAQAIGLWVAWVVAWPLWFRNQPTRRFGLLGHTFLMLIVAGALAAVRVTLKLG